MKVRKTLALAGFATSLALTGTVAPVMMASSSGTVAGVEVVESADAATGWGSKCAVKYVREYASPNWVALYRIDKYWYTTSVTDTDCIDRYKTFIRYEAR